MSIGGLNWQTLHLPLAAGLNQKSDTRALQPPFLGRCIDVQFDDVGGLQTRYPFVDFAVDIFGGGSLSDVRRIVENGSELLVFTKDMIYSWNAQLAKWVAKGTHLALKVEEETVFATTGDQIDCDRAELNGTIVYSWTELVGASTKGYVAAIDKTTGSVLMTPTALSGSAQRLRVTALTTKILLTFYDGVNGLYAYALDPASPATALAGSSTTVTNTNFGIAYDIEKIPGADQAVFASKQNPDTSYTVGTITAGLTVATSSKARTCDKESIAVACTPDGTKVQVARALVSGGVSVIQGDLITISTLADTAHINKAIGTATFFVDVDQIAAAFKTTAVTGEYRCHVFWSRNEGTDTSATFGVQTNWVDTGGNLGTQSDLVDHTGLVSRAWCHNERIYVCVAFAALSFVLNAASGTVTRSGFLQNTYFAYRDDGLLCAKATNGVAGGYAASQGHLPNVVSTASNVYEWCGVVRRLLDAAGEVSPGYGAREPRDITLTFDSNEARRCVRLGRTLYITGGEILQYDGSQVVEVGFHIYPWAFKVETAGAGGAVEAGDYAHKWTWRWDNLQGERERSTTAASGLNTAVATDRFVVIPYHALNITHKTTNPPAAEIWRTAKNPTDDAPFYLVTNTDPADVSGDNCYIANDHTAMAVATLQYDNYADATLTAKEGFYENGNVLENLAPPAATIIAASDTRLFLAGVAGDPDRVWYSKQRNDGEVAAFNDALTVGIPRPPGAGSITGMIIFQETPVVFRESSTCILLNDGYDNLGGGQNYVAREVPGGIGAVNQESIAVTDKGVVFKSSKGWYLLNRGWQFEYIGGPVKDYDDEEPLAVQAVGTQHQVRILTSERMLMLDTLVGQWAEWTIDDGLHACMWNSTHLYLKSTGPAYQGTSYANLTYGIDVETAWIKLADLQGFGKIDNFQILGEYRSAHRLQIRCARDYWKDGEDTYFQDKTWTVSPVAVGAREKVKHAPSIKSLEAIKIRITALGPGSDSYPTGEALKLTGLSLELGFERGLNRMLPSAQKQ